MEFLVVYTFFFCFGLYLIFSYYCHYVIVLLGLEVIMLSLFCFMVCLGLHGLSFFLPLLFLLLLVCMGGYGVSLVVCFFRTTGVDFWSL